MKTIVKNQRYQESSSLGIRLVTIFVFILTLLFTAGCSSGGGGGGDDGSGGGSSPVTPKISIVAKDINTTVLDPLTKLSFTITSIKDIETFK